MTRCLQVPKTKAEAVRQKLRAHQFLDTSQKVSAGRDYVYLPLKKGAPTARVQKLGQIKYKSLNARAQKSKNLHTILKGKLTVEEIAQLRTAYDRLGDLIIIEIPLELVSKQKIIGTALLQIHASVRAVFKKTGIIQGKYRTRKLDRIAGTGSTEVTLKENGRRYMLDAQKVFYTPRLSTERERIAKQVKPNEVVLDMFAGVGPFSILIAKTQPQVKQIHAIDLNPSAVHYLKENARLNKVESLLTAHVGDASIISKELKNSVDRVIMNLPKSSSEFIPAALRAVKPNGIIHFYSFAESVEQLNGKIQVLLARRASYKILRTDKVKPYAPGEWLYAADIKVLRKHKV